MLRDLSRVKKKVAKPADLYYKNETPTRRDVWTGPYRAEVSRHPCLRKMLTARIVEIPTGRTRLFVDSRSLSVLRAHVLTRFPSCEGLPDEPTALEDLLRA